MISVAMFMLLGAAERFWYALPLIVVVSLVYGATRHEYPRPILEHAVRFSIWLVTFMAILFVILWFFTRGL